MLSGGMLQCWGLNDDGELGNGTTAPIYNAPTPISGF